MRGVPSPWLWAKVPLRLGRTVARTAHRELPKNLRCPLAPVHMNLGGGETGNSPAFVYPFPLSARCRHSASNFMKPSAPTATKSPGAESRCGTRRTPTRITRVCSRPWRVADQCCRTVQQCGTTSRQRRDHARRIRACHTRAVQSLLLRGLPFSAGFSLAGGLGRRRQPLTTRMLKEVANDNSVGRAEGLRRSMLALMETPDKPHFAHPMFWAPFVVVGEGGMPKIR